MYLQFIKVDLEEEGFVDIEDFLENLEPPSTEDHVLKPVTIKADSISRIEPSELNSNWTDVFTVEGDVMTSNMPYADFKEQWFSVLNYKPKNVWDSEKEDSKSLTIKTLNK